MLAAGFAITLGLVLVVVRNSRPQDLAAVAKTESRPALDDLSKATSEPPPAAPAGAPVPSPVRAFNPPALPRTQSVGTTVAPLPPPVLLQPPPEDALKKAESTRRDEPAKQDTVAPAQAEKSAIDKQAADQEAAGKLTAGKSTKDEKDAAPPRPQPQAQSVQVQSAPSSIGRQQQAAQSAAVAAPPPPPLVTNGLGITAPALRGRPAALAGNVGRARFAFDYTIRHDSLTVTPLAPGFLQVTAATPGGQQVMIQSPSRHEAGTSVTLPVPAGSLNLTIEFSSRPVVQDLAASLDNLQNSRFRAKTASPAVAPVISRDKTGHVEEQTPTADPLSITVAVPSE
jgi:hypothetical protein